MRSNDEIGQEWASPKGPAAFGLRLCAVRLTGQRPARLTSLRLGSKSTGQMMHNFFVATLASPNGITVTNIVRLSAEKEFPCEKIGIREFKGCGDIEVWNIIA